MELWKRIQRVEGDYEVSTLGRIRNGKTGKILSLNARNGYLGVTVRPNGRQGKSYGLRVHRCVAEEFVCGYFDGAVVNHRDGNKLNNSVNNLEWVTLSENTQHAYALGLVKFSTGVDHVRTKLTLEQILSIKKDSRASRVIANEYGVSKDTILDVKTGDRYKKYT